MAQIVSCILGAGFSSVAGIPLAKNLFRHRPILALSNASEKRFRAVLSHYGAWETKNPDSHAEEYIAEIYSGSLPGNPPKWEWVVEYVGAVIASAGTPPASMNRNPRYSNRINRPTDCQVHRKFFQVVTKEADNLSVITANYDILIERALRHRFMRRPVSPGCHYGGMPKVQRLKGAAQPFSIRSPDRLIEMTGHVPVYKLHGSLSWGLSNGAIEFYQDMRPAFRNGGNAAIVPPVPEKTAPDWLKPVWCEAKRALGHASIWVVCGYSAPTYDVQVRELLAQSRPDKPLTILLSSPDSEASILHWKKFIHHADIIALPGLPEGIGALARTLRDVRKC
jgi:hypothetical protein